MGLDQQNAKQIFQPGGYNYWPYYDLKWRTGLPTHARELLVKAAATWFIEDVSDDPYYLGDSHVVLYNALCDPVETVHHIAAVCLSTHIRCLPMTTGRYLDDGGTLLVSDISEKIDDIGDPPWKIFATDYEAAVRAVLPRKDVEPGD